MQHPLQTAAMLGLTGSGLAKSAGILDQLLEFAQQNPRLVGTGLGAAGGGALGYALSEDEAPADDILTGALLGGGLGFAGGSLYGTLRPKPLGGQPLPGVAAIIDRKKQQELEKQFVDKILSRGSATPREINDFQFGPGDLDAKIERAKAWREANPDLDYRQKLDMFDTAVPVVRSGPLGDGSTNTSVGGDTTKEPTIASLLSNPLRDRVAPLFGGRWRTSGVRIDEQESELGKPVFTEGGYIDFTGGGARTSAFNTLVHEVKGHAPQDAQWKKQLAAPLRGLSVEKMGPSDEYLRYLLSPLELERRVQAVKDWGQEHHGNTGSTPEDFMKLINRLREPLVDSLHNTDAPLTQDVLDIPEILKRLKSDKDRQTLLDYLIRLAPGIVSNKPGHPIMEKLGLSLHPMEDLVSAGAALGLEMPAAKSARAEKLSCNRLPIMPRWLQEKSMQAA